MATVAMDAAVNRAADELEKRGYYQDAIDARMKWNNFYYRIAYEIRDNPDRDVGDHPGVKFLLDLHAKISGIVGEDICHALRLHDLWNFGMTIGVVFRCQDNVPAGEYFEHFSLFTGCVAYWVSNVACMCFSPIPFVCGLAAMGVERLVVLFVVPKIQNKCFELSCNKL